MNKLTIWCYREETKTEQYNKEKHPPKPHLRKFWRRPDVSSKTAHSHLPFSLDLGLHHHSHAVCWKDFRSYWPACDGDATFNEPTGQKFKREYLEPKTTKQILQPSQSTHLKESVVPLLSISTGPLGWSSMITARHQTVVVSGIQEPGLFNCSNHEVWHGCTGRSL